MNLPTLSLEEHLDARREVDELKQGVARYFNSYDPLICPTLPVPARPHDRHGPGDRGRDRGGVAGEPPSRTWDWTRHPGVSVPFGWSY